jgi:hypothetical protein
MRDPIVEKAYKRVKAKKGFYVHLISYISVGIFFFLMNLASYNQADKWWFFFPMLPWLIGLLIHYFLIFGIPGTEILTEGWEERQMEREVHRLLRKEGFSTAEKPTSYGGELPEPEERLELPTKEKLKEKRWDERDLV